MSQPGKVVINTAATRAADANGIILGSWRSGLFSCFDSVIPNCVMTCCCPCVSLAQASHRVGIVRFRTMLCVTGVLMLGQYLSTFLNWYCPYTLSQSMQDLSVEAMSPPEGMTLAQTVNWSSDVLRRAIDLADQYDMARLATATVSSLASIVIIVLVWVVRARVRRKFSIPGSCCIDCMTSWCCTCCAIAQIATHTTSYVEGDCQFGPRGVLPAYSPTKQP
ncbi:hypothetical protein DYB26_008733 [Aphanomyces astaci]|uniref:Uncharacterized protein n=1 Tax=Aphanomyces astaci TaxID=112090 RepID=A0A397DVG2_APHAT|nr:hypothetical protein DYB34_005871 [Aphanomyces astaci]RHY69000.1 hypothetical protein DYB38_007610 [Aphanomyces astaci]RHZ41000.1 hypothetical protein DYB26_008733 [Aphanomyces astaci]